MGDRFHGLADASLGGLASTAKRSALSRRRIDQLWFRLPIEASARFLAPSAKLVYSPDFTAPPIPGAASIITIHDLAFLKAPDYCPAPLRRYLTEVVPRQLERASRVVVVSKATRRDVLDAYHVDERLISVIPNAADDRFFHPVPLTTEQRRALRLPEDYLLTVGTLEPRKNHATIFRAIERVHSDTGVPLVVVGRDGWSNATIRRTMLNLIDRGAVIDLTNAADDLLPGLYVGAAAAIQMSWFEGFGIPVVEALAAGTPVIASDIAAHREVSRDTATLVEPGDADALMIAVLAVLANARSHDSEPGRAAARAFSWGGSGTMLAGLLGEVNDG